MTLFGACTEKQNLLEMGLGLLFVVFGFGIVVLYLEEVLPRRVTKREMKRILIVEDERLILWSLNKTLSRETDYQIFLAEGAEEALEVMNHNVLDLIITDIKLPGKSGWDILEKAKELSPGSKSIVISATSGADLEREARIKGANLWFVKPVPLDELKDRVRSLI